MKNKLEIFIDSPSLVHFRCPFGRQLYGNLESGLPEHMWIVSNTTRDILSTYKLRTGVYEQTIPVSGDKCIIYMVTLDDFIHRLSDGDIAMVECMSSIILRDGRESLENVTGALEVDKLKVLKFAKGVSANARNSALMKLRHLAQRDVRGAVEDYFTAVRMYDFAAQAIRDGMILDQGSCEDVWETLKRIGDRPVTDYERVVGPIIEERKSRIGLMN